MLSNFPAELVIDKMDKEEFCLDLEIRMEYDEFVNAIGHESTVNLVNKLCGTNLQKNRMEVKMKEGDKALIIQPMQRLEEGKVLTNEEIMKMLKEGKVAFYKVIYEEYWLSPLTRRVGVSLLVGSSFPPSIRVYMSHLVGSRVEQSPTPWKKRGFHPRSLAP
jgi:hypothetical protein